MLAALATTSTSPVGSLGFSVPFGRRVTSPFRLMQYSGRSSLATLCTAGETLGLNTTCTIPNRSRRSTNTSPPWSRRRSTHPASSTGLPTKLLFSSPQRCVLSKGALLKRWSSG